MKDVFFAVLDEPEPCVDVHKIAYHLRVSLSFAVTTIMKTVFGEIILTFVSDDEAKRGRQRYASWRQENSSQYFASVLHGV